MPVKTALTPALPAAEKLRHDDDDDDLVLSTDAVECEVNRDVGS